MTAHRKTGVIGTYRTRPHRYHEASTTTRHRGYDVATIEHGFVVPGTLATYPTREAALAELERRAKADHRALHPEPPCDECGGSGWVRVKSADAIPTYWYCTCATGRRKNARDAITTERDRRRHDAAS